MKRRGKRMKSILIINHRSDGQLCDIINQINCLIGAKVKETFREDKQEV